LGQKKKLWNLSGQKKVTQPLGTKKSSNLSGQKKSRNLLVQKNHTTSWDKKNVLKIQILVTNKIQEIGTDHLGLVSHIFAKNLFFKFGSRGIVCGIDKLSKTLIYTVINCLWN
jgi:hypothetical protein